MEISLYIDKNIIESDKHNWRWWIFTFRSIQTQHSVDWKVSIGGADGADEAVEAAGGADGIFSCGGALG